MMQLRAGDNPLGGLTRRELDVLRALGQGRSLTEIADGLTLSYRTVANTVSQIKHKLNVGTTSRLFADRDRLSDAPLVIHFAALSAFDRAMT